MAAVVAAATAAWNAAVDQASQTYDAALSAAQAAWTEAEAAAWSQSTAATQAAFAAYRDILEDLQAQANAAWDDYQRTLQAAGGAGAGARYWSSPGLAGATGFCLGLGQGVVNIVNGVQDTVVGILNLPAMGINAIARAEEKAGILNPNDPLRVPYIPSPDWSRGLITDEAGTPGSWTDTHGWSKFFGATGVELIAGTWAAKANKAGQAVARVGDRITTWLGPRARVLRSDARGLVIQSRDRLRQFRIDFAGPGTPPAHAHFEVWDPVKQRWVDAVPGRHRFPFRE